MTFTRLLTVCVLLCGLFTAGCATRTSIGEVSVTLVDIKPAGSTLLESRAIMTLRYINENVIPVAFAGSNHKLYLNGTYVGKAVNSQAIGLAPTSTATQEVAVFFDNLQLIKQLANMGQTRTVSYKLESSMIYKKGDEIEYIPSVTSGSIDLSSLTQ